MAICVPAQCAGYFNRAAEMCDAFMDAAQPERARLLRAASLKPPVIGDNQFEMISSLTISICTCFA